jgi:anti-anti-sigma factor
MKLSLKSLDTEAVSLQCEGWITQSQLKPGIDPFAQISGARTYTQRVLLDLERTEFIDSSGIGWLMGCHKKFGQEGGCLVIHSVPPMIRGVFELLKLHTVFRLAENEAAARKLALEVRP